MENGDVVLRALTTIVDRSTVFLVTGFISEVDTTSNGQQIRCGDLVAIIQKVGSKYGYFHTIVFNLEDNNETHL
jgi:hypothetical protein